MEKKIHIKRVLILYSWNDWISQMRYDIMSKSPLLKNYVIEHCFALHDETESITVVQLFERIDKAIKSFNPEVLLLHTGAAFQRNPAAFFDTFVELKKRYPNLRLGQERWPDISLHFETKEIFENSKEMNDIENLLFQRVFHR